MTVQPGQQSAVAAHVLHHAQQVRGDSVRQFRVEREDAGYLVGELLLVRGGQPVLGELANQGRVETEVGHGSR
ncbi:hypothetical protein ABZ345_05465 [Lentzea sp. NPDC005914]|uniref:hypothetical protein n=1 Tax=Lentzea sp. NPDC005914 TaxID=3154572 RepID=UPI0033E1DC61